MEGHIDHVMRAWRKSEKPAIQHMGNPGQRVPVANAREAKGPPDGLDCQPVLDMAVFSDIFVIVKIEKLMMPDIAVGKKDDQNNHTWNNGLEGKGPQVEVYEMHAGVP